MCWEGFRLDCVDKRVNDRIMIEENTGLKTYQELAHTRGK